MPGVKVFCALGSARLRPHESQRGSCLAYGRGGLPERGQDALVGKHWVLPLGQLVVGPEGEDTLLGRTWAGHRAPMEGSNRSDSALALGTGCSTRDKGTSRAL